MKMLSERDADIIAAILDQFSGILATEVGYANGTTEDPSYEEVLYGKTICGI